MRKTKEEAELTRQEILKAAREVFSQDGYSGTSLEDVARMAGVTRGAIYWHFGDKYKLFITLLMESFTNYDSRIREIISQKDSPLNKIRTLMRETLLYLVKDENYRRGLELYIFKAEFTQQRAKQWEKLKKKQPELISAYDSGLQFLGAVEHLVNKGIEQGEILADVDPKISALAIVSYLSGLRAHFLSYPDQFSVEEVTDDLVDFMLAPLTKPRA